MTGTRTRADSGRLRDESPTETRYRPTTVVHCCAVASQTENARSSSVNIRCLVCPGCRVTFWNPLSCRGGSPAVAGSVTYTCAISVPARVPMFVTSTPTLTNPPGTSTGVTVRCRNANVV